jgi:CRISPR-associated protein (TIGR03986 family)
MAKTPVHSEDIRDNRQAVAPYNFVPLPETIRLVGKPPSQGFYDENLLTGKISCSLTNSTPIYVRAAQTLHEYEGKQVPSDPFYYGSPEEKLLIPGSSIRGMLRTMVEVISQARVNPITEKQLFYRSVEDTSMGVAYRDRMKDKVRAGFYHEDKSGSWISPTIAGRISRENIVEQFKVDNIYKAGKPSSPKRTPLDELQHKYIFVRLSENALDNPTRFYDVEELSRKKLDGLSEGVLVITGDMQNKKSEFVFLKQAIDSKIKLTDNQVYLFEDRDQLTQYQKFAFPKGRRGAGTLRDGDPVFYLIGDNEENVIGFGRAYMFRLPYKLSPAQMVSEELLGDPELYDMAEVLFGYVPQSDKGRKQVAGRIFITDAVMQGKAKEALLPQTKFKILSSPKPTAFQHYLTQEKPNTPAELYHYDTGIEKTTLRGNKFYWHKGSITPDDYQASEQTIQEHDTQYAPPVKPIKENQVFKFEIQFENLRLEELGSLLWVLDKAGDSQYRLKLGMGKPYGLGSVAISAKTNIENRAARYANLIINNTWHTWNDPKTTEKCEDALLAFARWVLRKQDATIEEVENQTRVQELLIMMSWNNAPSKDKTRYMELKEFAGKQGKFTSKRPVLPSPHMVHGKWLKEPEPKRYLPTDLPPAQLKSGDIVRAFVYFKDEKSDVYLQCPVHGESDLCVVRVTQRKPSDYILDLDQAEVLLEVIRAQDKDGEWLIECKTVDQ